MVALFNLGYLAQCKLLTAFYVHTNSFHKIFPRVELSAIDLNNTGYVHANSTLDSFSTHACNYTCWSALFVNWPRLVLILYLASDPKCRLSYEKYR